MNPGVGFALGSPGIAERPLPAPNSKPDGCAGGRGGVVCRFHRNPEGCPTSGRSCGSPPSAHQNTGTLRPSLLDHRNPESWSTGGSKGATSGPLRPTPSHPQREHQRQWSHLATSRWILRIVTPSVGPPHRGHIRPDGRAQKATPMVKTRRVESRPTRMMSANMEASAGGEPVMDHIERYTRGHGRGQ